MFDLDNNLKEILEKYPEIWKDNLRIKALLMDCFPQDRLLRNILYLCVEEKIVDELSKKKELKNDEVFSYKKRLINSYGCSDSMADKAIMLWIDAMNILVNNDFDNIIENNYLDESNELNDCTEKYSNEQIVDRIDESELFYVNLNDKKRSLVGQRLDGYFELITDIFEDEYIIASEIYTSAYKGSYCRIINDVFETLTESEQKLINSLYALNCVYKKNITELSREFNVTEEQIREKYHKAIRKLHHPSRNRKFRIGFSFDYDFFSSDINYGEYFEKLILDKIDFCKEDMEKIAHQSMLLKNIIKFNELNEIKTSIKNNDVAMITRAKMKPEHIYFLLSLGCFYIKDAFNIFSFEDWILKKDDLCNKWEAFDFLITFTCPVVIVKITKYLQREMSKRGVVSFEQLCDNKFDFSDKAQIEIEMLSKVVINAEKTVKEKYYELGLNEDVISDCLPKLKIGSVYKHNSEFMYLDSDISSLNLSSRLRVNLRREGIKTIRDFINISPEKLKKFEYLGRKLVEEIILNLDGCGVYTKRYFRMLEELFGIDYTIEEDF